MAWPGCVHAEVIYAQTTKQAVIYEQKLHASFAKQNPGVADLKTWRNHKIKLIKQLFQKWKGPGGGRTLLIIGSILLYIGFVLFMLYGLAILFLLAYFGEAESVLGFVLLALLFFALAVLCIVGLIRNNRKLKRLRYGEPKTENFPPRPPSKKLNEKPE